MIMQAKYPAPQPNKTSLLVAILWGMFVSLFLVLFQPFDIALLNDEDKMLFIAFFGVITFGVLFFFLFLLPLAFPGVFREQDWTVGKHILLFLVIFIVIATLNGLYINYVQNLPFNWGNYYWITSRTLLLGCIPLLFLMVLNYNQNVKRHLAVSEELATLNTDASTRLLARTHIIKLSGNGTAVLKEPAFLYAQSSGSYVVFAHKEAGKIQETLHRITLKSVDQQLKAAHIIQCHRSYMVNLTAVRRVTGNAQGLTLWLDTNEAKVPVSRRYVSVVRNAINALQNH